jgi:hypothetical protein
MPPPTIEELQAYHDRAPGCISLSAENFRVDFSRPLTSIFNKEAIEVFAEDFIEKVQQHGFYADHQIHPDFLAVPYLVGKIQQHLEYVRRIWKGNSEAIAAQSKINARRNRKTQVRNFAGIEKKLELTNFPAFQSQT